MKSCEENGRRRNLGNEPGIGEAPRGSTEIENLVEIAGEGGQFVNRAILPSHKCKNAALLIVAISASGIYRFLPRWPLRCRSR